MNSNDIIGDGAWIGIDFGTTNSCVAVYDRTRGGSKWIRIYDENLAAVMDNGKPGRQIPTLILLATKEYATTNHNQNITWQDDVSQFIPSHLSNKKSIVALIGISVERFLEEQNDKIDPKVLQMATLRSIKRQIMNTKNSNNKDQTDTITVTPLGMNESISIPSANLIAMVLYKIRIEADKYLKKEQLKKHLDIPGHKPPCTHCCIGVPASSTMQYRNICLQNAIKLAGFHNNISNNIFCTESTAAAMSYGLFVSTKPSTILVFDIGGGTTDVTIAEKDTTTNNNTFQVKATAGNTQLGGDDMDQSILQYILNKHSSSNNNNDINNNNNNTQYLLQQCRRAKVELCGDGKDIVPANTATIIVQGIRYTITQTDFELCIQPILQKVKQVIQTALQRYNNNTIHEVILIGGASRVPAIRTLLSSMFPNLKELCLAVNPDSAVAQGCAIVAASKVIPEYELKSALMLDTTPFPMGVLVAANNNKFVEIVPRESTLPAAGYATFHLADSQQPGVTIQAVEQTGDNEYSPIGEFTFLLHKLNTPITDRSVDIGMTLTEHGEFIVSIFDPNDPEHVRKREKFKRAKQQDGTINELTFDVNSEEHWSIEQILLIFGCIVVFFLYVAVKMTFVDERLSQSVTEVIVEER